MNCEYIKCPVCGKERSGVIKCPKCGFEYIPIDVENGTDIPIIMKAIQARKRWYNNIILKFALCVFASACISYILLWYFWGDEATPYSEFDKIGCFISLIIVLSGLSCLLVYIVNGEFKFKNQRNKIIDKMLEEKRKEEENIKMQELLEKKRIEEENKQLAIEKRKNELIQKYGNIDRTIVLSNDRIEYDLDKDIIVFGESKHIFIEGVDYKFSDIIKCELEDDKKVTKGRSYTTTQLSPGTRTLVALDNLVGRPDWATADAASSKKITVTHREPDKIQHRYRVHIITNNLSKPLVNLYFLSNRNLAREVYALITTVINQGQTAQNDK